MIRLVRNVVWPIALFALFTLLVPPVAGQERLPGNVRSELITLAGRAELLGEVADALGTRLRSVEQPRVTLTGVLVRAGESRALEITWQLPGKFRISDAQGALVAYAGAGKLAPVASRGVDSATLVQALVSDQVESILHSIATTGGVRFLGSRFRKDDGRAAVYTGPYANLYMQSLPRGAAGNLKEGLLMRVIEFDSDTLLLRSVRTQASDGRPESETRMQDWKRLNGESYPSEIIYLEDGREQFRFNVSRLDTGAKLPDSQFGEIVP